jgi:anti-sigma B factor antagonist
MHRVDSSSRSKPSSAGFEIAQYGLDEQTSVVSIKGELDLSSAPRLKWALIDSLQAGNNQLVVDLSLTTFMDSTALGVLIGVNRSLEPDVRLAIVCAQAEVLNIFELSGLDAGFAIFPTLDQALLYTRGRGAAAG